MPPAGFCFACLNLGDFGGSSAVTFEFRVGGVFKSNSIVIPNSARQTPSSRQGELIPFRSKRQQSIDGQHMAVRVRSHILLASLLIGFFQYIDRDR
jgi:hypothetical protein